MSSDNQNRHAHSPAGVVIQKGDYASLEFERFFDHPPEVIWRALTEPAALRAWLALDAEIDLQARRVEMVTGPAEIRWTGRILTWDPPRIFEYEWNTDARGEMPSGEQTVVRWELIAEAEGTRLKLSHRRLTAGTAQGFAPGTHAFLDRLRAHLGGEVPPEWMERYAEVEGLYR